MASTARSSEVVLVGAFRHALQMGWLTRLNPTLRGLA
jgi:hypothetical protein